MILMLQKQLHLARVCNINTKLISKWKKNTKLKSSKDKLSSSTSSDFKTTKRLYTP